MAIETPQEYTARILGCAEGRDPLDILSTTATRLRSLIAGRSPDALRRRPTADRWSVTEILAHLADAEVVIAWRIRSILAVDAVPVQAYDQDVWARSFKYADTDPTASLEHYDANRRATLALLARVDPARREHYGLHAERGRESIDYLVRFVAGHDVNHLRQIEQLLA